MRRALVTGLLGVLFSLTAAAEGNEEEQSRRRLIEQKIRLVETLAGSPAAKSAAVPGSEVAALVASGRKSVEAARGALVTGQLDEAIRLADEGLKAVSLISRRAASENALSDSVQRKHYDELRLQVTTYRSAAADLARDSRMMAAAHKLLMQIDPSLDEADRLAGQGRYADSNNKLSEIYRMAVAEISRLRAGQEVVLSLKFDNPADEYLYEQKRFSSHQIMVDMLVAEGKAEGGRLGLIEGFVGEGRRLKLEAETLADKGRHKDAVALMEKASAQMVRALQAMGVPVF